VGRLGPRYMLEHGTGLGNKAGMQNTTQLDTEAFADL
jgi:hypothetical protein